MRKLATYAALAFLVFYIVTAPAAAATTTGGLLGLAQSAAESLAQFVEHLNP